MHTIIVCYYNFCTVYQFRALYKGLSIPLLTSAGQNAFLFAVYRKCVSYMSADDTKASLTASTIASLISGISIVPITTNIELIKLRLQMKNIGLHYYSRFAVTGPISHSSFAGPMKTVMEIITNEGWSSLFKGFHITFWRDTLSYPVYFLSYEYTCQLMAGKNSMTTLHFYQLALAGGIAGSLSWTMIFPLDVIKSRLQVDGVDLREPKQYTGIIDCYIKSYRTDGWKVFFRGLGVTIIRGFPVNAVTLAGATVILQLLKGKESEVIL